MADNRARVVASAMALFRARGVAEVGIAEVMERAGMTQGGFYRHFASKDALAVEACRAAFAEAEIAWRAAVKGSESAATEALRTFYLRPRSPERTCPILSFAADARKAPASALAREWRAGVASLVALYSTLTGVQPDRATAEVAALVGARLLDFGTGPLDGGARAASFPDDTVHNVLPRRDEGEMP